MSEMCVKSIVDRYISHDCFLYVKIFYSGRSEQHYRTFYELIFWNFHTVIVLIRLELDYYCVKLQQQYKILRNFCTAREWSIYIVSSLKHSPRWESFSWIYYKAHIEIF